MSASVRPARVAPRVNAGSVVSRMNFAVENGWIMKPSATSPATSVMCGPTPPSTIRGTPNGFGPGLKNGVISVCV